MNTDVARVLLAKLKEDTWLPEGGKLPRAVNDLLRVADGMAEALEAFRSLDTTMEGQLAWRRTKVWNQGRVALGEWGKLWGDTTPAERGA